MQLVTHLADLSVYHMERERAGRPEMPDRRTARLFEPGAVSHVSSLVSAAGLEAAHGVFGSCSARELPNKLLPVHR
jgi:hypothetical protein